MRRVIVTIDRLTLKGVRYEDRHAVAQGLQEQLAALFAEPGMAERLVSRLHDRWGATRLMELQRVWGDERNGHRSIRRQGSG